ncbi:MAG: hypothetical protein K1X78_27490 [Verrucomicrobiaceae bacterium]|nr:hypothetical protein [Verrucomicrobiaceae bacterium]
MPRTCKAILFSCCLATVLGLSGCETMKKLTTSSDDGGSGGEGKPSGEAAMLLGMTYAEAAAISPKKLEVPPFFRVAADEIEVVKTNKDGSPRTVRAKGKVFLEVNFREPATALCQEAYFGDEEVIMRGHPVLKRGVSLVEGLADSTVFYMFGLRLRVIGRHRVTNEGAVVAAMPDFRSGGHGGGPGSLPRRGGGSWEHGPNPLLPPLSPSSVPENIRTEMQKAAEAEAVLQRARMEPVMPLKEDAPPEKPAPLIVPPEPEADKKTQAREPAKEPEKKPPAKEPEPKTPAPDPAKAADKPKG